jgi:hypothetical protein
VCKPTIRATPKYNDRVSQAAHLYVRYVTFPTGPVAGHALQFCMHDYGKEQQQRVSPHCENKMIMEGKLKSCARWPSQALLPNSMESASLS